MSPLYRPTRLLALIGLALTSSQAEAYVLVPDADTGTPRRWIGTEVIIVVPDAAGSQQIEDGTEFTALISAAERWNRAIASCTELRLEVAAPEIGLAVKNDGRVAVVWISTGWPYPPEWSATTGMQYGPRGQIIDADIEVNEEHHQFTTQGEEKKIDLESTLAHELGHVLGLDHTCYLGQEAPNPLPLDHLGHAIGPCSSVEVQQHALPTMFPGVSVAGTALRTPEADDAAGVCALYPAKADPGGCALAGALLTSGLPGPGGIGALLLLVLALLSRRAASPRSRGRTLPGGRKDQRGLGGDHLA